MVVVFGAAGAAFGCGAVHLLFEAAVAHPRCVAVCDFLAEDGIMCYFVPVDLFIVALATVWLIFFLIGRKREGGGVAQWGWRVGKVGRQKRGRLGIKRGGANIGHPVELERRQRRRGNRSVTHVLETFLGEDGVQQPGDGCVVGHSVYFAEARQGGLGGGGGCCDFAISISDRTREFPKPRNWSGLGMR